MIWKPIPGYEGYYEISESGIVRSLDRVDTVVSGIKGTYQRRHKGRVISQGDWVGYPTAMISMKNKKYGFFVHRMVAQVFIGPCPEGMQVRHRDGDRGNPHKDNLLYGTQNENEADKKLHGRTNNGERNGQSKLTRKDVSDIRELLAKGVYQKEIATMFGVVQSLISQIHRGKIWNETV